MRVFLLSMLAAAALAGCTPPCNSASVCAIHGQNEDATVCDGSSYVACGDDNRGQIISCVTRPEHAVCTPQGWTFEPTASASSSQ